MSGSSRSILYHLAYKCMQIKARLESATVTFMSMFLKNNFCCCHSFQSAFMVL